MPYLAARPTLINLIITRKFTADKSGSLHRLKRIRLIQQPIGYQYVECFENSKNSQYQLGTELAKFS